MIPFSRLSRWQYLESTCQEVVHTRNSSCLAASLKLAVIVSYEGFKLYLPLYLVSSLASYNVPLCSAMGSYVLHIALLWLYEGGRVWVVIGYRIFSN